MLKSKFFNDFSNVAQGAFSTINAIREELDILIKNRLERLLVSKGLVTKEENDIALERIDNLKMKIDGLEAIVNKQSKEIKSLIEKRKIKKGK
tara:strand:- start:119 stop:397 length:279 start_codon:yes stop_codon:yes gene_type:complete